MRPSHVALAIETAWKARRPLLVQGSPGIGKTELFPQVCQKLGIGHIDIRLPQYERVDLSGVPYVDKCKTLWATPGFWPTKGSGIIVFDEVNAAPRELQPILYQIFQERRLGEYRLPEGWVPMAVGNLETDGAITVKLSTAFNNRVIHVRYEVHNEDWEVWANTHDVHPMVLAYCRFQPENLHQFDPKSTEKAFASPRSWHIVSDLLKTEPDEAILPALVAGTVGQGPANAFAGFRKLVDKLPSLADILAKPDKVKIPVDQLGVMYALTGGLARMSTAKNFASVMAFANRLPREWQIYLVKDAARRDEAEYAKDPARARIKETDAYVTWAAANGDVI